MITFVLLTNSEQEMLIEKIFNSLNINERISTKLITTDFSKSNLLFQKFLIKRDKKKSFFTFVKLYGVL